MSFIKNKKALSEIIAVALFILMSISALLIVWTAATPLLTKLSPEFSCTQAKITAPIDIENVCYNSETQDVELTLKRKVSDSTEITTMEFTITFSETESLNFHCGEGCEGATILKPGERKTYFFYIPENSEIKNAIVGINSCTLIASEQITECRL